MMLRVGVKHVNSSLYDEIVRLWTIEVPYTAPHCIRSNGMSSSDERREQHNDSWGLLFYTELILCIRRSYIPDCWQQVCKRNYLPPWYTIQKSCRPGQEYWNGLCLLKSPFWNYEISNHTVLSSISQYSEEIQPHPPTNFLNETYLFGTPICYDTGPRFYAVSSEGPWIFRSMLSLDHFL